MNDIITLLKQTPTFRELEVEDLQSLAHAGVSRTLAPGELLFKAGELCEAFILLQDGLLEVTREEGRRTHRLVLLRAGHSLGELSLVKPYQHNVSARAITEATVVVLSVGSVEKALEAHPSTLVKVLRRVALTIKNRLQFSGSREFGFTRVYESGATRLEHDLLGEREVPAEALYGVQTLRGEENFPITGIPLSHFPTLIKTLAMVKQAAARANSRLELLNRDVAKAIDTASQELIDGHWHGHFVVDMVQGGAGTSTNMNANEVIANRALELMGYRRGDYAHCSPNDHVNLSQSTNDVYPTAVRTATIFQSEELAQALLELKEALLQKGLEFREVLKMGRTQLQDAVPMTLGQEFTAFAVTTGEDVERLREISRLFLEINMGGTAIGTGINADPRYPAAVVEELRAITGLELVLAENLVEATPDTGAFVLFSGVLKRIAVKLSKMCNDLRLLSSGPRCGLAEINLPPMQPGSSIMPGKVNPVIPEVVNQVAFQVIGNDLTITLAAEAGQLQLNVMEPILTFNLFQSISILTSAIRTLISRCIVGITANVEHCRSLVEHSIGIVTAVVPAIGYERAGQVAKESLLTGRPVRDIILERGYLSARKLDEILSIEAMTTPRALPLDSQQ